MTLVEPLSERALILAPLGRDSQIALMIMRQPGFGGGKLMFHNVPDAGDRATSSFTSVTARRAVSS